MEHKNNPTLTPRARQLRKTMTKEERKLWYDFLRAYPLHIYRQRTIGKYIADFYCPATSLVIELDGSQHCEPAAQSYDAARTSYPPPSASTSSASPITPSPKTSPPPATISTR